MFVFTTDKQPSTRDHDQIDNRCECVCISCQLVESVSSPPRVLLLHLLKGACPGTGGGHALGGVPSFAAARHKFTNTIFFEVLLEADLDLKG